MEIARVRQPLSLLMALVILMLTTVSAWWSTTPVWATTARGYGILQVDPQVIVDEAMGHAKTIEDAIEAEINTLQSTQTQQNIDLMEKYDKMYDSEIKSGVISTANASSQSSYSQWQKVGYYSTFTPEQQHALQMLQPILAANDITAHYEFDPLTGNVHVQAGGAHRNEGRGAVGLGGFALSDDVPPLRALRGLDLLAG